MRMKRLRELAGLIWHDCRPLADKKLETERGMSDCSIRLTITVLPHPDATDDFREWFLNNRTEFNAGMLERVYPVVEKLTKMELRKLGLCEAFPISEYIFKKLGVSTEGVAVRLNTDGIVQVDIEK